jgi:pilus assembly protein CpaB
MVAIGCGLVAALLTSKLAGQSQVKKIPVPVAKQELRQGTFVGSDPLQLFNVEEKPEDSIIPGTITNINDLKTKTLQRTVDEGSPILKRDLTDNEGIGRSLPEGYRAMTIKVTTESGVTGFIGPGSFVDLLASLPVPNNPAQRRSKIFLQNMQVLALNTDDRPKEGEQRGAQPPQVVTLAVKPSDAEKINWLSNQGSLPYMLMRKPGDKNKVDTSGAISVDGGDGGDELEKDVVVAKAPIGPKTDITKDNYKDLFVVKRFRSKDAPEALSKLDASIVGKKIYFPMTSGQPLTDVLMRNPDNTKVDTTPKYVTVRKNYDLVIYNGATESRTPMNVGEVVVVSGGSREGMPQPSEGGSEGK